MSERCHTARQTCRLRGRVYFNKGRKSLPCLVRDISYEGARIVLSERVKIPDAIELYVPKNRRLVPANVCWCHGDRLGLTFPDVGHVLSKRRRPKGHS